MAQGKPVAVVAGAGPGNGAALARRFAAGGYAVAVLARDIDKVTGLTHKVEGTFPYACDVGDAASVAAVFGAIGLDLGPVSALLCAQAVVPAMKARGSGSILFTGATASLRGGKCTAAFAPAKAAQRSLAESMARTLWPAGIHVALMIVDGVVDLPATRKAMAGKGDDFFVDPEGLAETAWFLAHQDRRAWSFEVEVRPFGENW